MSTPIFISIYSNGDVWVSSDVAHIPGAASESSAPRGSEAGTLLKHYRIGGNVSAQKLTTLTGSGNSSASALAASGGATTKAGAVEIT